MKTTRILAVMLGCTLALGSYGCKKSETQEKEVTAMETTVQAQTPSEQKPAANAAEKGYKRTKSYFKLPGYKGGEIDLASYAKKPVMLMFFTESCPYCRKAAPFIEEMSRKYLSKGLGTIGICIEDDPAAAAAFAQDFKLSFPIAYQGRDVARQYRAQGVPFIFLLTKEHAVYNVWPGYDPSFNEPIIQAIEKLVK
jgi:thiol-disulfide isomerase/thioredoxin